MAINWNNGQVITLKGDSLDNVATCINLNVGQVYGIMLYNSAMNDSSANLVVTSGNAGLPPVSVIVPGTTGGQGRASIVFFNGSDSTSISLAMLQNQPGTEVQAFICSVKMPLDAQSPDFKNIQLPMNGQPQSFNKFTRYYSVPAAHWYQVQIRSDIDQFFAVQFTEEHATVFMLTSPDTAKSRVQAIGKAAQQFDIKNTPENIEAFSLRGDDEQYVFVNATSVQNSKHASISMQSLQSLYS